MTQEVSSGTMFQFGDFYRGGREIGPEASMVGKMKYLELMSLGIIIRRCTEEA